MSETSPASPGLGQILGQLEPAAPSRLSTHDASCCRVARAWFEAMARSHHDASGSPPVWVSDRWRWGPVRWPLYWCDAVRRPELDCGALADLAGAAFIAAGQSIWRVQLLERHDPERLAQWRARWAGLPGAPTWIFGQFAYHEAVAALREPELALWDPVDRQWREQDTGDPIAAIRITAPGPKAAGGTAGAVTWRGRAVPLGTWVVEN